MSIELKQFQDAEGLSDAQMAELISSKLDRAISERGYRMIASRRDAPAEWLQALNIVPQEPGHVTTPGGEAGPRDPGPASNQSPSEPRKTTPDTMLPFEPQTAHTAIVLIYTMAGKGAAATMGAPPVAEAWSGYAPHIAQAYIEWAKESETVAKVIAAITLGGAGGKVVMLHASLLVETLIISGKFDASQLIPPGMRAEQVTADDLHGDATSVGKAFYPGEGGENGGEPPPPKPKQQRQRKAKATE